MKNQEKFQIFLIFIPVSPEAHDGIKDKQYWHDLNEAGLISPSIPTDEYEKKLKECSSNGNNFCTKALGEFIYSNGNFYGEKWHDKLIETYPYLTKGNGEYIHLFEFEIGLKLNSDNNPDYIIYFKKCALAGYISCAYEVSESYPVYAEPKQDNTIQNYAWKVVSTKLTKDFNNIFSTNIRDRLFERVKKTSSFLGVPEHKRADDLIQKICATIPTCINTKAGEI